MSMQDQRVLHSSPPVEQTLALARLEASRLNHDFLATEHLLLGIIRLGQSPAVTVLRRLGLDLAAVRLEMEEQLGTVQDHQGVSPKAKVPVPGTGNLPYTPRVKRVLAFAAEEARALNHSYVGAEHILLGLLREGDGVVARVLNELGVDTERTRQEILR
jgi:ATP-dependent Clp protease ATP-binding subunit ClpC